MPIHKMNFSDGVFYAKQVGYVDNTDAKMWVNALNKYARNSAQPIIALVDAEEVNRLCPTVVKIFEEALTSPNIQGIAIATGDFISAQKARVASSLSELSGVRVFPDMAEARTYAEGRVTSLMKQGWSSSAVSSFSFAYACVG